MHRYKPLAEPIAYAAIVKALLNGLLGFEVVYFTVLPLAILLESRY
jgi:hypothetical protein